MAKEGTLRIRIVGDSKPLESTLDKLSDTLGGFGKVAGGALLGAGAVAGAVFVDSLFEAMDRERMNDKLAAQLRLDDDAAEQAGKVAAEVYAGAWGDSIGDVNAAIQSIGTNLADLNEVGAEELESMTTQALDLATAFDKDVNEVIAGAGQLLRNDLAESADEAFDLITRGLEEGGDRAGDLLETLNEYAEPLKSLGLDGADAIGLLVEGLEQGAFNADKVGDAIKEFSVRAIDGSKATSEAFQTIGLDADEMAAKIAAGGEDARLAMSEIIRALADLDDEVAQDAAGVALFGSTWEDLGPKVILALDPVINRIDDVSGATERMGEVLNDNLATKWASMWRTAKEVVVQFAEPVVEWLGEVFDVFEEEFAKTEPVLTDAEEATAAFEAALAQRFGEDIPAHFETFQNGLSTTRDETETQMDAIGRTIDALVAAWDAKFPELKDWWNNTFVDWIENEGGEALLKAIDAVGKAMGKALAKAFAAWFVSELEEEYNQLPGWIKKLLTGEGDTGFNLDPGLMAPPSSGGVSGGRGRTSGGGSRTSNRTASGQTILHDGGVVPGRIGEEVPALLMAGETVVPTHKPGNTFGGHTFNVTVNTSDQQAASDTVVELRKLAIGIG